MIELNGKPRPLPEEPTLAALLAAAGTEAHGTIIELNGEVVAPGVDPRSVTLRDGDRLHLFRIVAGG